MDDINHELKERVNFWQWVKGCMTAGSRNDRRNSLRYVSWMLAWGLTFLLATWALKTNVVAGSLKWAVAIVPDLFALAALFAYLRFLREADELTQKIQLDGLALGFGVGVIFAVSYQLLERAGAPQLTVSDTAAVMMVAWAIGQLIAQFRYR